MRRKERSRSPDRRDAKLRLLKPDTSELDILSAVERRVLELKSQYLVSEQPPEIYIEPFGYDQSLGATQPNSNTCLDASDLPTRPLMTMAYEFLDSTNTVLLLMGDPGSGKTVFVKQLERKLWGEYNGLSDAIPILVNLSEFTKPVNDLLGQVLQSRGFHPEHNQVLKRSKRQFILICDGYDEIQVQCNIYNYNKFNRPGHGCVKLIIACQSCKIGRDSDGQFRPERINRYDLTDLNLFQKVAMAPFTYRMVVEYVEKYANRHLRPVAPQWSGGLQSATQIPQPETPPLSSFENRCVWSAQQYMETLSDVPSLMKLVENPFILSVVLTMLSTISNQERDVLRSQSPSMLSTSIFSIAGLRLPSDVYTQECMMIDMGAG